MKCYHGQQINSIKLLLVVDVLKCGKPLFSSITTNGVGVRVFELYCDYNLNLVLLSDVNKLFNVMVGVGFHPLLTSINIRNFFRKILNKEYYKNTFTSDEIEKIKNQINL